VDRAETENELPQTLARQLAEGVEMLSPLETGTI
jgi:hypothetical protein